MIVFGLFVVFVALEGGLLPTLCHFSGPPDLAPPKPAYCSLLFGTLSKPLFFVLVGLIFPLIVLGGIVSSRPILRDYLNENFVFWGMILILLAYLYFLSSLIASILGIIKKRGKNQVNPAGVEGT